MQSDTTSTHDTWVIRPRLNPQARLRLLCFSYAGGGASVFYPWRNHLPAAVEMCSIQLPGRENRLSEPPFTQLSPLLQTLARMLHPYLDMPYAFFGHSMGALVSFELARQLRRQRRVGPVHLFVSAHRAPQLPFPAPPIHQLPERAFVSELRRFNGIPEVVLHNAELMQLILPTLRADFTLCETYSYTHEEPLDCSISAFGGVQDEEVSHSALAAWHEQTHGAFTLRRFPGDHFFLFEARERFLRMLHEDLTQLLQGMKVL